MRVRCLRRQSLVVFRIVDVSARLTSIVIIILTPIVVLIVSIIAPATIVSSTTISVSVEISAMISMAIVVVVVVIVVSSLLFLLILKVFAIKSVVTPESEHLLSTVIFTFLNYEFCYDIFCIFEFCGIQYRFCLGRLRVCSAVCSIVIWLAFSFRISSQMSALFNCSASASALFA